MPARQVPKLDGFVPAARSQDSAVGAESHGRDRIPMRGQGAQLSSAVYIQECDGLVVISRSQGSAIGTEGHRENVTILARLPTVQLTPTGHVPKSGGVVQAPRSQHPPIWAEDYGVGPIFMGSDDELRLLRACGGYQKQSNKCRDSYVFHENPFRV